MISETTSVAESVDDPKLFSIVAVHAEVQGEGVEARRHFVTRNAESDIACNLAMHKLSQKEELHGGGKEL